MSPEEGIAFVAERMLQYEVNMTDLFEDPADGMVFLHFETATSSESFDKAVKQVLEGLVGGMSRRWRLPSGQTCSDTPRVLTVIAATLCVRPRPGKRSRPSSTKTFWQCIVLCRSGLGTRSCR